MKSDEKLFGYAMWGALGFAIIAINTGVLTAIGVLIVAYNVAQIESHSDEEA